MKLACWYFAGAVLAFAALAVPSFTWANFFATTANSGSSFSAASNFCVSEGSTSTVTADFDSYVDQVVPSLNFGTSTTLNVSSSGIGTRRRTYVHFALPTIPRNCSVSSATLTLDNTSAGAGRTLVVFRLASSWTESGITWNNQPSTTGSASAGVAAASGLMTWTVTSHVQSLYTTNNGLTVRDNSETSGFVSQAFTSREATGNKPSLTITWG